MEKISCKDCVRTCCDDADIKLKPRKKGVDPLALKTGNWLYVRDIIWVKKKNNLWRCRAFDPITRLCKIWENRPVICRYYFCPFAKKKKNKEVKNMDEWENSEKISSYQLLYYTCLSDLKSGKIRKRGEVKKCG